MEDDSLSIATSSSFSLWLFLKPLVIGMLRAVHLLPNPFPRDAFLIANFLQCPVKLSSNPVSHRLVRLLRLRLFGNISTYMVGVIKGSQPHPKRCIGYFQISSGMSYGTIFNLLISATDIPSALEAPPWKHTQPRQRCMGRVVFLRFFFG